MRAELTVLELWVKQLSNEVVKMEITEYSTKLTGKYLLNDAVHGDSKALELSECSSIIIN